MYEVTLNRNFYFSLFVKRAASQPWLEQSRDGLSDPDYCPRIFPFLYRKCAYIRMYVRENVSNIRIYAWLLLFSH